MKLELDSQATTRKTEPNRVDKQKILPCYRAPECVAVLTAAVTRATVTTLCPYIVDMNKILNDTCTIWFLHLIVISVSNFAPFMMASQPREYTPKCVLVTGGAGFIASFVVTRLLKAPNSDHRVVVFDKMDYCASVRNLDAVANHPNLVIVKGNILDHKAVLGALRTHEVDTVMHFAAQSHVDNSFGNSMSFSLNNTLGTHMLLEACRLAGTIRRFINVSTDEVYGGVDFEWEERLDEKVQFVSRSKKG